MLFWHTPVNYPLWFLRDLICMSALSPLFYAFFKYLKIYGLLILLALYLSVWETNIAGLSMTAIMFFGAGSYMGIYKKECSGVLFEVPVCDSNNHSHVFMLRYLFVMGGSFMRILLEYIYWFGIINSFQFDGLVNR